LPAGHLGGYRNGGIEYTVRPDALVIDGVAFPDLTLYDSGAFTVRDPATGEPGDAGRFLPDPCRSGLALQSGGRLARRA
jgi:hypothetical protein